MNKFRVKTFIILICCLLINIFPNKVYATEKLDVLFISSYNPDFISFNDQVQGIEKGLNNNVNLQIDYLDFKIFDTKENEGDLYNLIKSKINNYGTFDAIIVGDDDALEFGLKYRDDLFKNIPIVFLGVENKELRERAVEYELVSGVSEIESINDTISLIANFHQKVENIIFLNNSNESSVVNKICDEAIAKHDNLSFEKIYTSDLTIDEFKEQLKGLTKKDAIITLYPSTFKDYETTNVEVNQIMSEVVDNVPIYNVLSYGVGQGSIGGKVVSHFKQGEKAGEIVQSILNGENPKDLYVEDDDINIYLFDYKMIKKYNINKSKLPIDSIIINDPKDILHDHGDIGFSILLVVIGLVSIIVALLLYVIVRKRYEKELIKAMEISEETNRLKGYFMTNISHELKTPITVIMSALQLAKFKSDNFQGIYCEGCSNNFRVINDNCYRLLRLINNIMDMAKVDDGSMELKLKNINIVELVEDTVLSVVDYGKNKNIDIVFDTTDEEVIMAVDIDKIERIVLNILSNSIKFSNDNGKINVNLGTYSDKVVLIIEDNGIGMDEQHLNRIFERFVQIDESLTRKNEGSGIGLSIVKAFVDLHQGKICVDSAVNEGTKFIIELPIRTIDEDVVEYSSIQQHENSTIIKTKIELSDIYF